MPRQWDLDDLAGIGDLAYERGIGSSSAAGWRRYPDFPEPLIVLSTGAIYSRAQVRAWQETRWPPGTPGSGQVRYTGALPRSAPPRPDHNVPGAPTGRARRWAYDHIVSDLRRRISDGEFPPGSRLPARPVLAEQYGATVRLMARPIAVLCREGLLYTRRASGTYVTPSH